MHASKWWVLLWTTDERIFHNPSLPMKPWHHDKRNIMLNSLQRIYYPPVKSQISFIKRKRKKKVNKKPSTGETKKKKKERKKEKKKNIFLNITQWRVILHLSLSTCITSRKHFGISRYGFKKRNSHTGKDSFWVTSTSFPLWESMAFNLNWDYI